MKIAMVLIAASVGLVAWVASSEFKTDRMLNTEKWRNHPIIGTVQSLNRALLIAAAICLISGLTLLISNLTLRLRRKNQ